MRLLNNKFLLACLVIILMGLFTGLALVSFPNFSKGLAVGEKVRVLSEKLNLREPSTVEIYRSEESSSAGELKFKFDIKSADRPTVEKLSQNLGVNDLWTQGIKLSLNQESLDKIKPILPLKLNLSFKERQVNFSNGQILKLDSGLRPKEVNIASAGGTLKLKGSGVSDFDLNIVEPAIVLRESSNSGKLYYSSALSGLYPLLARVYTIDLRVSGKSIVGSVKLK